VTKAIGCISGGLDSTLAVALVQRQGIEVVALHVLHLWHPLPADPTAKPRAVRAAEALGAQVRVIDGAEADLEMVQHPRHGLGKRMNPCIDCRIWVLRRARELMDAEAAAFVFTGEVLGQRPMSQNRPAMNLIEREAGLTDLLLRPLSAKCLEPTRPEREGLVDREKLFGIAGRSRHEQMRLAAELGITDYPSPAGGCLVTDPAFAFRLKELLDHGPPTVADVQLLKVGRHFRLPDGTRVVIGRSEADNLLLERLFQPGDGRLEAADIPGPTTLVRGTASDENLTTAAALTLRYIKKVAAGQTVPVMVTPVGSPPRVIPATAAAEADMRQWMISPEDPA
jgi:tRNA U34 2-thiouridine synthase MnmA/TrmU